MSSSSCPRTIVRFPLAVALLTTSVLTACRAECPRGKVDDGEQCVALDGDRLSAGHGAGEGASGAAGNVAAVGGGLPIGALPIPAGNGAVGGVNVIVNLGPGGAPQSVVAGTPGSATVAAQMAGTSGSVTAGRIAAVSAGGGAAGAAVSNMMLPMAGRAPAPAAGTGAAGMTMTSMAGRGAVASAAGSGAAQKPMTPANPQPNTTQKTVNKCGNGVLDTGEKCDPMLSASCPTMASCDDKNDCTTDKLDGSAAACSAVCLHSAIVASTGAKDRCCPKGATAATDSDCTASCGDGVVSAEEKCDPMSSSNKCPTEASCQDKNDCTNDVISGTGCQAVCTHTPKPDCPAKQTTSTCGDGMLTGTEKCDPRSDKKCPTSCVDDDPCTDDKLEGSADNCTAYCPHTRKTDCGKTQMTEPAPSCGDGVVGPGEVCDPKSSTPCPTSCSKKDGCAIEKLEGSDCTAVCKPAQITEAIAGDKCCPPGATASTDSDCQPKCGDGVVSPGEKCDPMSNDRRCPDAVSCEDHDPCTIDGVVGSAASCDAECFYTQIGGCRSGCGNGIVELDEECDHAADGEEIGVTCDINCHEITAQVPCAQEEDCWEKAPGTICVEGNCVAVRF